MSQVKPRTIRVSDNDWAFLKGIAGIHHLTVSQYVTKKMKEVAHEYGYPWEGVGKEGRPTKERKA